MTLPPLKRAITTLDLLSLRLFLTVCEERSIARAAERESIAASAVTKRIQELEHLFGVQLLYRNAKGTVPTTVGTVLASHARDVFLLVDNMRSDLSQFAVGTRGHVRLGAIASALTTFLIPELKAFSQAYPQITLDVRELLSQDVVHAVATGTVDVGVYATPPVPGEAVESFAYRQDRLVAVVPREHALADAASVPFEALLATDMVGVLEGSSVMTQLRRAALGLGRQLNPRFRVQTNEVAREMVAAGFGVAVLPQGIAASSCSERIVAVPLSDAWARRELLICVRHGGTLPTQAALLSRHLIEGARDGDRGSDASESA